MESACGAGGSQKWSETARPAGTMLAASSITPAKVQASRGWSGLDHQETLTGICTDSGVRRDALWLAAQQGDVASLEVLATPALLAETDEFGRGALARAAEAG